MHSSVALDLEQVWNFNAADLGDSSNIMAQQVNDHQVFGAILFRSRKPCSQRLILGIPAPTPCRALHWPSNDSIAIPAKEQLRRHRKNAILSDVEISTVIGPLRRAELLVECAIVARECGAQ